MDRPVYQERTYRNRLSSHGLKSFHVQVRETDLYIAAAIDLTIYAYELVHLFRRQLENYIKFHPEFQQSLVPLPEDPLAPEIVQSMISAAQTSGVGPMAAVAGAVAERVGCGLQDWSPEVIVENGGDIYLNCKREVRVGVFAGESVLSNRLSVKVSPQQMPLGVCTSSGTVGPSLSFGKADAVCVLSKSTALADAAASHIGNLLHSPKEIQAAIDSGRKIPGVTGILIIMKEHMGAWGEIELA